jgi:hypothetical protein
LKYKKYIFISIGAIVVIIVLMLIFRPNTYKDFYKMFNKELDKQETVSKQVYDELQKATELKEQEYNEKIKEKDAELRDYENQLLLEQQKNYRYEKELNHYRNGDYDARYNEFSNTYNPKGNN